MDVVIHELQQVAIAGDDDDLHPLRGGGFAGPMTRRPRSRERDRGDPERDQVAEQRSARRASSLGRRCDLLIVDLIAESRPQEVQQRGVVGPSCRKHHHHLQEATAAGELVTGHQRRQRVEGAVKSECPSTSSNLSAIKPQSLSLSASGHSIASSLLTCLAPLSAAHIEKPEPGRHPGVSYGRICGICSAPSTWVAQDLLSGVEHHVAREGLLETPRRSKMPLSMS